MAGLSTPTLDIRPTVRPASSLRSAIPDFVALTKPEVNFLIVIATFTGFYLGYPGDLHNFPVGRMLNALFGTLLVASGTGTLNQYLEHRFDAQMRRTSRRPIAAERLRPRTAAWFGISLSIVGSVYLLVAVNALASALAIFTSVTYLLIYTPLKRITPLCTLAGAVPGAMPPLIGWVAASGSIANSEAWILYAVLFLWQFPHFMAIAWMYRDDYARAGYQVLGRGEQSGRFMSWQALAPSLVLIPVGMSPTVIGHAGPFYSISACILGSGFFWFSARLTFRRSNMAARRLLMASIVYLPIALFLMVLCKP
jgi:protoheme IX farnesyltransferase